LEAYYTFNWIFSKGKGGSESPRAAAFTLYNRTNIITQPGNKITAITYTASGSSIVWLCGYAVRPDTFNMVMSAAGTNSASKLRRWNRQGILLKSSEGNHL
jgi:hypothetical protein